MERWRDIPGYEGIYEASDYGNIRNYKTGKTIKPKLKKSAGGNKYYNVTLYKAGKPNYVLLHRIIAITWCNGYFNKATVNHIDGNTVNNSAYNLEWLSIGDNIRHAHIIGLYSKQMETILIDNNGNRYCFHSMICASKFLGRCDRYIYGKLLHGYLLAKRRQAMAIPAGFNV